MRCGQCHISIFRLCSIAQARFGEVRFSEQETDLEKIPHIYLHYTDIFNRKQLGQHLPPTRPKLFIKDFGHIFK